MDSDRFLLPVTFLTGRSKGGFCDDGSVGVSDNLGACFPWGKCPGLHPLPCYDFSKVINSKDWPRVKHPVDI